MIQRIFIAIGILLGLGLFGSLLFLNRPTGAIPLPPAPPPVVTTEAPDERPSAAKSAPEYAALFNRVSLALRRYAETHGHPYQADPSAQDGGLASQVLAPYGDNMSANDPAIFWRLIPVDSGYALCAQYMNPSQGLELSTPITEAARTAGFAVELQVCGDSAIGIRIDRTRVTTNEPLETPSAGSTPQLPPLPGLGETRPHPSMIGGGRPPVEPSAAVSPTTCEANPAIDERLSRLL